MSPEMLADLSSLFASAPPRAALVQAAGAYLDDGSSEGFEGVRVMAALFDVEEPAPKATIGR